MIKLDRISALGWVLPSALAALLGATATSQAQEITVLGGFPELAPFYERVAEGLAGKYPDLSVAVEPISLREHEKRVALGLSSGLEGVTVIELAGSTANRYLQAGLISALPDDLADFVTDPNNFGEFFVESASAGGSVYGVPLFRGQGALFYNTDMLAAAGLSGPPQTMDDYSTYADKLTQRDGDGNATVSGWSLRLSGGGQGIAEKFWINLFQFGGTILDSKGDGRWRANYANEAGVKALGQYLDNVHTKGNVSIEMPADAEAFERQQTAMFIRESWVIGDIAAKAPKLNYATAPLPRGSIALAVNLYIAGEGSDADMQAARDFVLAANEPDNLIWLLDNVGWLPNRSGVDYSGVIDATPAISAFVDFPADYEFFTLPAIGPIEEVLTRFAARLTKAFADESLAGDNDAIMAYLEKAEAETNAILKREGILAE